MRHTLLPAIVALICTAIGSNAMAVTLLPIPYGNPPANGAYAGTYIHEDWSASSGATYSYIETDVYDQASGQAQSHQEYGSLVSSDFISCTPPCTGMYADGRSEIAGGGITLKAVSRVYGNFDQLIDADPSNQAFDPAPAYDANIQSASASATVIDRLLVTAPVSLTINLTLDGQTTAQWGSNAYETYAAELPNEYFASGAWQVNLTATVWSKWGVTRVDPTNPVFLSDSGGLSPSTLADQAVSKVLLLAPGEYVLQTELRTYTRIGTVNGPTIATQLLSADYGNTGKVSLIASDPTAISSASGLLTFTPTVVPAPPGVWLLATALAALGRKRVWRRRQAP